MQAFWRGFEKRAYQPKRSYKTLKINELDPGDATQAWTAKIDGAHTYVSMEKGETPALFSHRISKRTGKPILYNPKLPHIKNPAPITARLRGETYALGRDGKVVDPELITALLNRTPERSIELQKELGLKTRTALIDVDEVGGKDASEWPFSEKRKLLASIVAKNKDFTLPALATSPAAKAHLRERIIAGTHPQTKEGLIVHEVGGAGFAKAKIINDHDVYVRSIFHEEGVKPTRTAGMAGGFHYSWSPDGPIKGRVGTGFDHAMKLDMARNPEKYVGRVARVNALGISKSETLLKPSFVQWHVEKNLEALR